MWSCNILFFTFFTFQLRSAEEESQKKGWTTATDTATEEKLQQIDKDMKEQEMLIKGYQQVSLEGHRFLTSHVVTVVTAFKW